MSQRMFRRMKVLAPVFFVCAGLSTPAHATFHLMQIEQVIGGINGDTTAQAVQLRMRSFGQNLVSQGKIVAYDATGSNPVLVLDLTSNVSNGSAGDRVLIASANFADFVDGAFSPDFVMGNLIPASYLAAGRLTFESDGGAVLWSLSWGGANYTGPTTGTFDNDGDAQFGPSFAGPLPSDSRQALQFKGTASAASSNNAADYALTEGASVWVNNARQSFTLVELPFPPGDVTGDAHVTGADSLLINQTLVGIRGTNDAVFAATGFDNGDVNRDGAVSGSDSLLINQVQVELRSYLVTQIVPGSRADANSPIAVTIFGIGFPTNAVTGASIGPPVNLALSSLVSFSEEEIDAIVPAGGGTGTGMVSVTASPSNGVLSFATFSND